MWGRSDVHVLVARSSISGRSSGPAAWAKTYWPGATAAAVEDETKPYDHMKPNAEYRRRRSADQPHFLHQLMKRVLEAFAN